MICAAPIDRCDVPRLCGLTEQVREPLTAWVNWRALLHDLNLGL
jgi:hypothetical protein